MFKVITSLPLTFYSRAFYWHLMREWEGIGAGFIIVATLLGLITVGIQLHAPMHEGVERVQAVLEAMPEVTMKNHKLSIDKPVPYSVKVFDTKDDKEPNRLVIDTNYAVNDTNSESSYLALNTYMDQGNMFVLVTSDKLITRQDKQLRIDKLDTLPDGTFTHDEWSSISDTVAMWVFPGFLMISAIGLIIVKFIEIAIGALIVMLVAMLFKTETNFDISMRLAAAAGIPVCVLAVFLSLPFWVKFVIWIGYVIFGLSSLQPQKSASN